MVKSYAHYNTCTYTQVLDSKTFEYCLLIFKNSRYYRTLNSFILEYYTHYFIYYQCYYTQIWTSQYFMLIVFAEIKLIFRPEDFFNSILAPKNIKGFCISCRVNQTVFSNNVWTAEETSIQFFFCKNVSRYTI